MARVRFLADYDHRWPSRAMSHFRANGGPNGDGVYTVRRVVAEAAVKSGRATSLDEPAKAPPDGAERKATESMAVRDPAADGDDASGDELESAPDDRAGSVVPHVRGAGQ